MTSYVDSEDALVLDVIEACDNYVKDYALACEQLKRGFLKLTMAKRRLPAHTLGEVSFKEEFEATSYVVSHPEGYYLSSGGTQKTEKKLPGGASSSTIMWFSGMPPNDLRQAQTEFRNGLQTLLSAAASAQRVQKSISAVEKHTQSA